MSVSGKMHYISFTDNKYTTKNLVHRNITRLKKGFFSGAEFPDTVIDLETEGKHKGLLPLTLSNSAIDVFHFQDRNHSYFAIETLQSGLSHDDFYVTTRAVRFLLSYLTGKPIFGDICEVIATESGIVNELQMYPAINGNLPDDFFPPIPLEKRVRESANGAHPEFKDVEPLEPAIVSRCLENILKQPELLVSIQYLIEFSKVILELRGVLLTVAMGNLIDGARDESDILKPFNDLGINLTDEEAEAVKQGEAQLQTGRFLSPGDLDQDSKKREETFKGEMTLYTAINKLLLKKLGYSGLIIDWGATVRNRNEPKFTKI
jgi:hypothetical protein